jgi:aldose 1-epimerase
MSRLSRRTVLVSAAVGAAAVPTAALATAHADPVPDPAAQSPDFWTTPTGTQWTIRRGNQKATLVELGGGILDWTVGGVPYIDTYPLDAPIKSAGRVLVPWPNRLGNGLYTWNGAAQQVPINEVAPRNNAIHGLSRWLPFHPVKQSGSSITLSALLAPSQGYPFPLEIVTRWSLTGKGLRVDHMVTNLGPVAAPFGLGAHPYFRIGDALVNDCVLSLTVTDRLTVDDRLLPTGKVPVAGTPYDFSTPHAVGTLDLDTAFTGIARGADGLTHTRLTAPNGHGLEHWQDANFGWIQLFTGLGPAGRPRGTLAIEAMTCPPDAFRSGENLITLAPHGRFTGSWGVNPF